MSKAMILTGCASGIGKHLAERLYGLGHQLVVTDIDETGLERACTEGGLTDETRIQRRKLDVRDAARWDAVTDECVERFGRVDVVLNVAGYLKAVWTHEMDPKDVALTIDVNVKGLIYGTNAALRRMVPQRAGHVVNIASIAGLVPVAGLAAYSASKHAARAYSIAAAQEVRKHGVYVTAVCPGVVATPMMDIQMDREEAELTFSGKRPLSVDEVASAVIDRALVERPLELVLSTGGGQAIASKIGNLFPSLLLRGGERARAQGRQNQAKLRSGG